MSWTTFYLLAFPVLYAFFIGYAWSRIRKAFKITDMVLEQNDSLIVEHARLVHICRALALRLSSNGHVDLDPAEVIENGELRIFAEEDEIRVLAK